MNKSLRSQTKLSTKKKEKYVDNEKLYNEICNYLENYKQGKNPKIPDYVGECFYKIALKVSKFPCFKDYPFIEDLISIAVLNCLNYIKSFNPEKSKNPFSYFTQTVYNSFVQEIKKQKKYLTLKNKAILNFSIENVIDMSYNNGSTADLENELRTKLSEYYLNHADYL